MRRDGNYEGFRLFRHADYVDCMLANNCDVLFHKGDSIKKETRPRAWFFCAPAAVHCLPYSSQRGTLKAAKQGKQTARRVMLRG